MKNNPSKQIKDVHIGKELTFYQLPSLSATWLWIFKLKQTQKERRRKKNPKSLKTLRTVKEVGLVRLLKETVLLGRQYWRTKENNRILLLFNPST